MVQHFAGGLEAMVNDERRRACFVGMVGLVGLVGWSEDQNEELRGKERNCTGRRDRI
jgi:hypothetical protein